MHLRDYIVFHHALCPVGSITLLKTIKSFSKTNASTTGVETAPHGEGTEEVKYLLVEDPILYIGQIYLA